MSVHHPIVALTGSSGAGTTTAGKAMQRIFDRLKVKPAVVAGDSFHRFTRRQMAALAAEGKYGENNHFSLAANHLDRLEALFQEYGQQGTGQYRHYVHEDDKALIAEGFESGTFSSWRDLPADTDLLFYEGLHAGVVADSVNLLRYVDLLIGVVPIVNLEWIQKIHRDTHFRGYSQEAVIHTILGRMEDYVRYIVPQFGHTHVNFQRVPMVDTSNPFASCDIPTDEESIVVIHCRKAGVDFPQLLQAIPGSFRSRPDTLVIPGNRLFLAFDLIIQPWVEELMSRKQAVGAGSVGEGSATAAE